MVFFSYHGEWCVFVDDDRLLLFAHVSFFSTAPVNINFSEVEHRVLKVWDETGAFQKTLEESRGRPEFSFYDVSDGGKDFFFSSKKKKKKKKKTGTAFCYWIAALWTHFGWRHQGHSDSLCSSDWTLCGATLWMGLVSFSFVFSF